MKKLGVLCLSVLTISVVACTGGVFGGDCFDAECVEDPGAGTGTDPGGLVTEPPAPNPPTCTSDADCTAPYVCNIKAEKCVPPAAKNNGTCDPIEGIGCEGGQQCVNGVCMDPLSTCQDNDDCPAGYLCQSGICQPDGGPGGCLDNNQCPGGQVCIGGQCKPEAVCNIPHAPDRLAGTWQLDSTLNLRDGLEGLTKGILSAASTLQSIIDGKFTIKGVPSIFTSLISGLVQDLVKQYVPSWGTQLIQWLSNVNDAIDTWRVVSLETLQSVGNDQYTGSSVWTLVEFDYQGAKVQSAPSAIPGLGQVTTESYTAREVCGVLFIDKHKLKNQVGKVIHWAINALLTALSCTSSSMPCYTSVQQMLADLIDCKALGQAVAGADSTIPGIALLVEGACNAAAGAGISLLLKELDELAVKVTYMSLSAKANISPTSNQLLDGRWYGVLGGSYGKGNFEGGFSGLRK